eukprot:3671095-Rhodomonas_salina.2
MQCAITVSASDHLRSGLVLHFQGQHREKKPKHRASSACQHAGSHHIAASATVLAAAIWSERAESADHSAPSPPVAVWHRVDVGLRV